MPLAQISILKGSKTPDRKTAIMDQVYLSLRETFDVPADDRFITITEHEPDDFAYGRHYGGVDRSDELVIVQLTVSNTRPLEKKRALFKRLADGLEREAGLRPDDIFINLVETKMENWSFGYGIAHYADRPPEPGSV